MFIATWNRNPSRQIYREHSIMKRTPNPSSHRTASDSR